jgi:hypothetical protein
MFFFSIMMTIFPKYKFFKGICICVDIGSAGEFPDETDHTGLRRRNDQKTGMSREIPLPGLPSKRQRTVRLKTSSPEKGAGTSGAKEFF